MNSRTYKFRPFEIVKENPCLKSFVPGARSGKLIENIYFENWKFNQVCSKGHRICCDSRNLYVFGGYNFLEDDAAHNLYKEILCYNFVSKHWKLISDDSLDDDCPDELASSSMLMYGKTLVVFGGTSYPFGMRCSNKVTLVSVDSEDSYRIQEMKTHNDERNQPPGQYGMSIVSKDNFLYTVGGTQGFNYTADIYRYMFYQLESTFDSH